MFQQTTLWGMKAPPTFIILLGFEIFFCRRIKKILSRPIAQQQQKNAQQNWTQTFRSRALLFEKLKTEFLIETH